MGLRELYIKYLLRHAESMQTAAWYWMPQPSLIVTSFVVQQNSKYNDYTAERSKQRHWVVKEWDRQPHCQRTLDSIAYTVQPQQTAMNHHQSQQTAINHHQSQQYTVTVVQLSRVELVEFNVSLDT